MLLIITIHQNIGGSCIYIWRTLFYILQIILSCFCISLHKTVTPTTSSMLSLWNRNNLFLAPLFLAKFLLSGFSTSSTLPPLTVSKISMDSNVTVTV